MVVLYIQYFRASRVGEEGDVLRRGGSEEVKGAGNIVKGGGFVYQYFKMVYYYTCCSF